MFYLYIFVLDILLFIFTCFFVGFIIVYKIYILHKYLFLCCVNFPIFFICLHSNILLF